MLLDFEPTSDLCYPLDLTVLDSNSTASLNETENMFQKDHQKIGGHCGSKLFIDESPPKYAMEPKNEL